MSWQYLKAIYYIWGKDGNHDGISDDNIKSSNYQSDLDEIEVDIADEISSNWN